MSTEQYLLSFDFAEITREISGLQSAYTSLTTEIKRSSEDADQALSRVVNRIDNLTGNLSKSTQTLSIFYNDLNLRLKGVASSFKSISRSTGDIAKNLAAIGGLDLSKLSASESTIGSRIAAVSPDKEFFSMDMQISATSGDVAQKSLDKAQRSLSAAKKAIEETNKADTLWGKTLKRGKKLAVGEAGEAFSAIRGMLGRGASSIGAGGFAAGGIVGAIGLMVLGIYDEQRVGAERGEMLNAAEAAGGLYKKNVQKGIDNLAAFGEYAQFNLGISRKEIQKVTAQVANMGIEISTTLTGTSKNFEDVNRNVITSNLALDKYFGLAAGTNMAQSLELMQNYGYSLDTATESMKRLRFTSQAAGMDMEKFVNSVMSGSAALVQYQIDVDDVSQVLLTVKQRYEDLGIGSQRAGSMAAGVTTGLAQGFTSMSTGMEMIFGKELFPEAKSPYEARLKFKEMFLDKGPDQDINRFHQLAMISKKVITKDLGITNRAESITAIEQIMGRTTQEAIAIYEYFDDISLDKSKQAIDPKALKEFAGTFKREGQTLTDLFKAQKNLMKGLAAVGRGMLKAVVGILGVIGIWVKSMPGLFKALMLALSNDFSGADAILSEIDAGYATQMSLIAKAGDDFREAGVYFGRALSNLGDTFKELADAVKAVYDFDPGGMYKGLSDRIDQWDRKLLQWSDQFDAKFFELKADFLRFTGDKAGARKATSDKNYLLRRAAHRGNEYDKKEKEFEAGAKSESATVDNLLIDSTSLAKVEAQSNIIGRN